MTVTHEDGTISEPDETTGTGDPISIDRPNEEPFTLKDFIKNLIKNLLDMTNSIDLSNKLIDILTDSNSNNDIV